jgi:hypothetical protein
MSTPFRGREVPPAARQEVSAKIPPVAPPSDSFPDWAERAQTTHARHDAITRNLNTWSNYKNWAERMRSTWEREAASEPLQGISRGGHNPPSH